MSDTVQHWKLPWGINGIRDDSLPSFFDVEIITDGVRRVIRRYRLDPSIVEEPQQVKA